MSVKNKLFEQSRGRIFGEAGRLDFISAEDYIFEQEGTDEIVFA